jgi:hypothetical protein
LSESSSWISLETVQKIAVPVGTLLLSLAVYLGTREANAADRESKSRAQCREGTISLLNEAEQLISLAEGAPTARSDAWGDGRFNDRLVARAHKVNVAAQFVEQDCRAAGVKIPVDVQRTLCTLREFVPDTQVRGGLVQTANAIAAQSSTGLSDCATAIGSSAAAATGGLVSDVNVVSRSAEQPVPRPLGPFTLYIHYPQGSDVDAVNELGRSIAAKGLAGHRVLIPPAEAIEGAIVSSTLRCLKATDCAYADRMVEALNAKLQTPGVRVLDLSARYGARTDIRNGRFELWLAARDLAIRSPPP